MNQVILAICLFGQVPPPPEPISRGEALTPPPQSVRHSERLKTYLLTRLTVDLNFDAAKIAEVERKLDKMSKRQLQVLANVYYERATARKEWEQQSLKNQQQLVLNQAQLNLQRAQAYRDHLKREYDRALVQQQMEQNLLQQGIQWQQQMIPRYGWFHDGGPYHAWHHHWGYRR